MSPTPWAVAFAAALRGAEDRLRACGLLGRDAFAALCRHLAARLDLPPALWPDGPDAPPAAALAQLSLPAPGPDADLDLFGLVYERFFSDLFKSERGQYFTPQPLVALMVDLAALSPGETVLDPTCGSGGFLIEALRRGAHVQGTEVDPELVVLARLNLALAGVTPSALATHITPGDAFAPPSGPAPDRVDVILANPPFSVPISDPDVLVGYTLAAGRERVPSDELFLELAWRRLRPGGRLVAVLPRSILANRRTEALRSWLETHFARRAVVSLPEGVFRPFGGTAAQAVVVALDRRPVPPGRTAPGWIPWVVTEPGYDVTRKVYRPTAQDDLAALRVALAAGTAPRSQAAVWLPEHALAAEPLGVGVPRVRLDALAQLSAPRIRPADTPDAEFVEVDLADVDKSTGEVQDTRVRLGGEFVGEKASFVEGDVLFSRLRPQLCGVAVVSRPAPGLPTALCGSTEWLRLRATTPEETHFLLLAARSRFVRDRLTATSGQTRPRVRLEDLPGLEVPDPGAEGRALLAEVVAEAHATRLAARRRLDAVARLYEAFGRGELDQAGLLGAVRALAAGGAGSGG